MFNDHRTGIHVQEAEIIVVIADQGQLVTGHLFPAHLTEEQMK